MPAFYTPQTGPTGGFRIGEALAAGYRDRSDLDNASQLRRIREEEAARARAQEIDAAESRRIKGIGEQLALRGQILGTVETPADYAAALPVLQGYNLPMGDLPQDRRSTASETFRAPAPGPQITPAWMPASWDMTQSLQNRIDLPAPVRDLPQEEIALPGIAPEEVATTVQRRAQIGLPLNLQQKYQDADLGRQIQREELAKRSEKYKTQIDYADRAADLADKRFGLQESRDERLARLEREKMGIERERLGLDKAKTAATLATSKAPTEGQAKAGLFGAQISEGLQELKTIMGRGYDPTSFLGSAQSSMAGVPILNALTSSDAQQWKQTVNRIANAALRFESGAAIGETEAARKIKEAIPQQGDGPEVVAQKIRTIETIIEGLKGAAGPAGGGIKPAASNIPTVSSQAAYDALPPGSQYRDPAGKIKTKKAR